MKRSYRQSIMFFGLFSTLSTAVAQEKEDQVLVNQGVISVADTGIMSTIYDFNNTSSGVVKQDGLVYYYANFNNDNIYSHSNQALNSKAVFKRYEDATGHQLISGEVLSEFYHVELDNAALVMGFDLKNEMNVRGSVDFKDGIVQVDSLVGMLTFHQGAVAINPTDRSHADGFVEKIGNESFQFPKGDDGMYRYARISAPEGQKDAFVGKYNYNDAQFFKARSNKEGVIRQIDTNEFWIVEKATDNSKSDIILTLSWDERTTLEDMLVDPAKELRIVRWDAQRQIWVIEGGVVDLDAKEISTPTSVQGYGFFTLATIKTELVLDGDLIIYNLVTPNGDDKNDYFIITNIQKFPNNTVEIYNRWGVKVYETSNYDSHGNVFRGYSDGRVTIDGGNMLPSGTYYYIVTYEYKDANGSRMIKKSGNLHLETH